MSYKINIPKPCNESWEDMNLMNDGRYCSVCEKIVYDFTNLSNRELVEKIEKNGKLCARYRKSQLDIDLFSPRNNKARKLAVIITISSSYFISNSISAEITKSSFNQFQGEISNDEKQINKEESQNKLVADTIHLSGTITSIDGPIAGATIKLKDTPYGTVSNEKGEFLLIFQSKLPITLIIRHIGFKQKELTINKPTAKLDIQLNEDDQALMGEVVVIKNKPSIIKKVINYIKHK